MKASKVSGLWRLGFAKPKPIPVASLAYYKIWGIQRVGFRFTRPETLKHPKALKPSTPNLRPKKIPCARLPGGVQGAGSQWRAS